MTAVCFYFQVHQPFRLRSDFDFFSIGTDRPFEDEEKNREILRKVSAKCYLPANTLMLELIRKHQGRFRVAYSISGVALEQFALYEPQVIESFRALAKTGCVEFLAETYYHSLAFLYSEEEFLRQVKMHREKMRDLIGVSPKVLRNTELVYNDRLGQLAEEMGFTAVLAEGADRILDWRSPNHVYRPLGTKNIALLLKNYRLSDDIAFRFSNREWSGWPLTSDKFANWLQSATRNDQGSVVNLFMDYETFGEHQWESTGIFAFLRHLPEEFLRHPGNRFMTPSEVAKSFPPVAELSMPGLVSWADSERDVSAWLGNHMQQAAAATVYGLEKAVVATRDAELMHAWRKLQTSDHFYYMSTKYSQDGDVHKYFSPYESPYDGFIHYANAINHLIWKCNVVRERQRLARRTARIAKQSDKAQEMPRQLVAGPSMSTSAEMRPLTLVAK